MAGRRRKTVGARELKTRLGSHLRRVREGTTLVITDRGHPIAELRPLTGGGDTLTRRLAELEALGVVSRENRQAALRPFVPIVGRGRPVSDAISEEREDRT
jgi:prevent-host-death family protein